MLIAWLIIVCILCIITLIVCTIISKCTYSLINDTVGFIGIVLLIVSFIGLIFSLLMQSNNTNSSYYYSMLERKKAIEEDINAYAEEIQLVTSGATDNINFTYKDTIIELNNKINSYNDTIYAHRFYKENYWLSCWCNTNIANLPTFEPIFNE